MKRIFIPLLLVLITGQSYSQQVDSLKQLVHIQSGKELFYTALHLAELLTLKNQDSALIYAEKAEEAAKNMEFHEGILKVYLKKIEIYNSGSKQKEALHYADLALETVEEYKLDSLKADVYSNVGNAHFLASNVDIAVKYYYQALAEFERIGDQEGVAISQSSIAMILTRAGQEDKAKAMYFVALEGFEKLQDDRYIVRLHFNLALLYDRLEQYDSCLIFSDRVIAKGEKLNSAFAKSRGYMIGGSALLKLKRYQEAFHYLEEGSKLAKQVGDLQSLKRAQLDIAFVHMYTKNYTKAIEMGQAFANEKPMIDGYNTYRLLYLSYKGINNLSKALTYHEMWKNFADSTNKVFEAKQLKELQTKYDTEHKDAEIQAFTQKTAIQTLELDKRNQWLTIGGVSTLLLLALGIAAYYRSQQNQIKTKAAKAEIEQRFLRSQLNPHFIFNALDSIQNYMLDNDAPKAGLFMSKFAKLMRQVLENSRENFIALSEEVKMLENYMELQKLQSGSDFSYQIKLDDQIDEDDFAIPPMFVQPFVENAIEHGIIQGKGQIEINFQLENDLINITVTDNGVGLSEQKSIQKQQAKKHNSLATSIIKERIESYNQKLKTNIELLVSEIVGANNTILGTKVELKVPFQLG